MSFISSSKMHRNIIRLSITGMGCAGCVDTIEKALAAVSGVSEASVNFLLNIPQQSLAQRILRLWSRRSRMPVMKPRFGSGLSLPIILNLIN